MTIGTSYFTLRDLRQYTGVRHRAPNHCGYVEFLLSTYVVEVEHDRVGFTTIDARMGIEIRSQPLIRSDDSLSITLLHVTHVLLAIAGVVCT